MRKVRLNGIIIPIFLMVSPFVLTSCLDSTNPPVDPQVEILNQQIQQFEEYFSNNSLDAIEIGDGYYQVIQNQGTGDNITGDEIVELKYAVRKFDTDEVIFFDSSYVFIPNNGFYVPNIIGNIGSLNYANTLMKEKGISDFYLASTHLFGGASGTFNGVTVNSNQMIKANYEIVDIRTEEEQKVFEDSLLSVKLNELQLTAEPSVTGLYTVILEEGTGDDSVAIGSKINIDYSGTTLDDDEFDSGTGSELVLSTLIDGWKEGLKNQKAGAKLILLIPSHLAYGPEGVVINGEVKINSFEPLKFEITLNSFENL